MLADEQMIERFAEYDLPLAQRIRDRLEKILAAIKKASRGAEFGTSASEWVKGSQKAFDLWTKALDKAQQNAEAKERAAAEGEAASAEAKAREAFEAAADARTRKAFDAADKAASAEQTGAVRDMIERRGKYWFVTASRQVLDGDNPREWGRQTTNYINKNIRNGRDVLIRAVDGDDLLITHNTARKAASRNTVTLPDGSRRPMTDEEYRVKLEAELHIDELAKVSRRDKRSGRKQDTKDHDFARDGYFHYRTAYYQNDTGYYMLKISAGEDGSLSEIYNIGRIDKTALPTNWGQSPASSKAETVNAVSDDSIPAPSEKSNPSGESSQTNPAPSGGNSQVRDSLEKEGATEQTGAVRDSTETEVYGQSTDLSSERHLYDYEHLVSLPDMRVSMLPSLSELNLNDSALDKKAVAKNGIDNAAKHGRIDQTGAVLVKNDYTKHEIRVVVKALRHGLDGSRDRVRTNARISSIAGEIIKNAVPINALKNESPSATGTYAMAALSIDASGNTYVSIATIEQRSGELDRIDVYDVAHAVSGRKEKGSPAGTMPQGFDPSTTSTISIRDFLHIVNRTFQSILSTDVLERLGEMRNRSGYYADKVQYSLDIPEGEVRESMEHALSHMTEEQVLKLLDGLEKAKGIIALKDLTRLLDSVAGDNKPLRNLLQEALKKPLSEANGQYGRSVTQSTREMKSYLKGADLWSKEGGRLIQIYGEGHQQKPCTANVRKVSAGMFLVKAKDEDGKVIVDRKMTYAELRRAFGDIAASKMFDAATQGQYQQWLRGNGRKAVEVVTLPKRLSKKGRKVSIYRYDMDYYKVNDDKMSAQDIVEKYGLQNARNMMRVADGKAMAEFSRSGIVGQTELQFAEVVINQKGAVRDIFNGMGVEEMAAFAEVLVEIDKAGFFALKDISRVLTQRNGVPRDAAACRKLAQPPAIRCTASTVSPSEMGVSA